MTSASNDALTTAVDVELVTRMLPSRFQFASSRKTCGAKAYGAKNVARLPDHCPLGIAFDVHVQVVVVRMIVVGREHIVEVAPTGQIAHQVA